MARSRRIAAATLATGATALFATACGSSLGYQTPCSVWVSMSNGEQRSTINNLNHQAGQPDASNADIAAFERLANDYCADPLLPDDTIGGMRDSRPP